MNKFIASHSASNKECRDFAVAHRPVNASKAFDGHVKSMEASITNMERASALIRANPITKAGQDLRAARSQLRTHQVALRTIALGLNYDIPGVIELFRIPAERAKLEDQLGSANGMLEEAKKYKTLFIDNGRPADFLEQLQQAITAVKTVGTTLNDLRRVRTRAFEALSNAYDQGRKAKAYLNGIFRSIYANDSEMLKAWETAHKVEYRRNPKRAETTQATTAGHEEVTKAA